MIKKLFQISTKQFLLLVRQYKIINSENKIIKQQKNFFYILARIFINK